AGQCQIPPHACYAAGVSQQANNCCSGQASGGVCTGPNLHPDDVPMDGNDIPLPQAAPPPAQPQVSTQKQACLDRNKKEEDDCINNCVVRYSTFGTNYQDCSSACFATSFQNQNKSG